MSIKIHTYIHTGVVFIAKFCVILRCSGAKHFSHTTVSLYAKWLNTDWTSYDSLMAVTLLNTRSTCKLKCHLSRDLHSSLAHTSILVNEGQNLDDDKISYHNFLSTKYKVTLLLPQIWSLHLIITSALSKICILLQRMTMTDLKPNPNEPIFGRRIGLHITVLSDWPEKTYLPNWSDHQWYFLVIWQRTWSQK